MPLMFLGSVGWPELLIIIVIAVVVFGGKRLPQLGSGLGQGIRNFKKSVTGEEETEKPAAETNHKD